MGMIGIIIGICILGIGIWNAQNDKQVSTNPEVQGEIAPSISPTEIPTPSDAPTTTQPTKAPTHIPTKVPTIKIEVKSESTASTSLSISKFQYPGASINSSSGSRLELTTTDSDNTVTDWYKNTINSTGMNVKSFVTTKANDNVINKLVGADGSTEIRIDITKAPNDSQVKIVVELK